MVKIEKIKKFKLIARHREGTQPDMEIPFPKVPYCKAPYQGVTTDVSDVTDYYYTFPSKDWGSYGPLLDFVECEPDDPNIITWVKIYTGGAVYLICDRPMFSYVRGYMTQKDGDSYGYINRVHKLEGKEYISTTHWSWNGWDDIMINPNNMYPGLPTPNEDDTNNSADIELHKRKYEGEHNKFWNWWGVCTLSSVVISSEGNYLGGVRPNKQNFFHVSNYMKELGLRPMLMVPPYAEEISDEDRHLGDKPGPFQYSYSIKQSYLEESIRVKTYLNGDLLEEYFSEGPVTNKTIKIIDMWDSLEYGTHEIKVWANYQERKLTFKKVANKPSLVPEGDNSTLTDNTIALEGMSSYLKYLVAEGVEQIDKMIYK